MPRGATKQYQREGNLDPPTRCRGGMMMFPRCHTGGLRYPQRLFPLALGKTRFLATGTGDAGGA